ncbi:MAG TPA: hypothetical protein VI193_11245, partial [Acidimicrobiia bacterium]
MKRPVASLSPRIVFIRDLLRDPEVQATWLVPRWGLHSCGTAPGSNRLRCPPGAPIQKEAGPALV